MARLLAADGGISGLPRLSTPQDTEASIWPEVSSVKTSDIEPSMSKFTGTPKYKKKKLSCHNKYWQIMNQQCELHFNPVQFSVGDQCRVQWYPREETGSTIRDPGLLITNTLYFNSAVYQYIAPCWVEYELKLAFSINGDGRWQMTKQSQLWPTLQRVYMKRTRKLYQAFICKHWRHLELSMVILCHPDMMRW